MDEPGLDGKRLDEPGAWFASSMNIQNSSVELSVYFLIVLMDFNVEYTEVLYGAPSLCPYCFNSLGVRNIQRIPPWSSCSIS